MKHRPHAPPGSLIVFPGGLEAISLPHASSIHPPPQLPFHSSDVPLVLPVSLARFLPLPLPQVAIPFYLSWLVLSRFIGYNIFLQDAFTDPTPGLSAHPASLIPVVEVYEVQRLRKAFQQDHVVPEPLTKPRLSSQSTTVTQANHTTPTYPPARSNVDTAGGSATVTNENEDPATAPGYLSSSRNQVGTRLRCQTGNKLGCLEV